MFIAVILHRSVYNSMSGIYRLWLMIGMLTMLSSVGNASTVENDTNKTAEARYLLSDIAKEIISRSGSSSQVLSLNLTNLIILLILKGLLFGAALIGAGHSNHYRGRKLDDNDDASGLTQPYISETELLLYLSYLMGEANQNYDCLKRVACLDPKKAKEYAFAGRLMVNAAKIFQNEIPVNEKYEQLLIDLQTAGNFGKNAGVCKEMYSCSSQNNVKK